MGNQLLTSKGNTDLQRKKRGDRERKGERDEEREMGRGVGNEGRKQENQFATGYHQSAETHNRGILRFVF